MRFFLILLVPFLVTTTGFARDDEDDEEPWRGKWDLPYHDPRRFRPLCKNWLYFKGDWVKTKAGWRYVITKEWYVYECVPVPY